jgi:putative membrane protein
MRFDARMVSLATYFAILLFNAYTLILYFNQQLTLYIHPRYILFTAAFNALSLIACGVGFVLTAWRMGSSSITTTAVPDRVAWRPSITILVAGFVLVAAYSLPARTLTSGTADQRSDNFNNDTQAQPSSDTANTTLALFDVDTTQLSIADWVSAFNMKTSASFYEGKKVDVGVPVYSPGWQEEKFKEDSWVRVKGSFTQTDEDIAEPAIIEPESIEPTDQPANPYVT